VQLASSILKGARQALALVKDSQLFVRYTRFTQVAHHLTELRPVDNVVLWLISAQPVMFKRLNWTFGLFFELTLTQKHIRCWAQVEGTLTTNACFLSTPMAPAALAAAHGDKLEYLRPGKLSFLQYLVFGKDRKLIKLKLRIIATCLAKQKHSASLMPN